ncbi:MAG: hypothetical protein AAGA48_37640 [Myxococcota bacterium]
MDFSLDSSGSGRVVMNPQRPPDRVRQVASLVAGLGLLMFAMAALAAPDRVPLPNPDLSSAPPWVVPPFGADGRGIPLWIYALQGARILAGPTLLAAMVVAVASTVAGFVRCTAGPVVNDTLAVVAEGIGALPRMVVVLVVALLLPRDWRTFAPIALTWAILAAPAAMDEAAATAGRLGAQRFVEALRAHGFSNFRIYAVHVIGYNLRPVIVRQSAEVAMQVVFLEIALSYLALSLTQPSFTHAADEHSWAVILYEGYKALLGLPLWHAFALGLGLVAGIAMLFTSLRLASRAR